MTSKEVTLEDFAASKPSNKLSYYDLSLLQKSNGKNIEFFRYQRCYGRYCINRRRIYEI